MSSEIGKQFYVLKKMYNSVNLQTLVEKHYSATNQRIVSKVQRCIYLIKNTPVFNVTF